MASLNAGKLNQRIELLSPEVTQDTFGDTLVAYVSEGKVWAHISHTSGSETNESATKVARQVLRVVVRYRADIAEDWRFAHRGVVYQIVAVLPDPDSGLESMMLYAEKAPLDAQ